ncbi:unnamed protein product [Rhizophagus irregularis]|nr:unnamed protein product [Rhizophagus irregularis]
MSSMTLEGIGKASGIVLRLKSIGKLGQHSMVTSVKKKFQTLSRIIIGSGNITLAPSTREVKRELRSSERRQSLPIRQRRSTIPPVSSLTTNDEMDISDIEQLPLRCFARLFRTPLLLFH